MKIFRICTLKCPSRQKHCFLFKSLECLSREASLQVIHAVGLSDIRFHSKDVRLRIIFIDCFPLNVLELRDTR
jgi:hypothetical protein